MKSALLTIGVGTLFLGCANFAATALQERVITCETHLNSNQLAYIITMQQYASTETKIAQHAVAKQIERATGIAGPISDRHAELFSSAQDLNEKAMSSNEKMREILEVGCEMQRDQWVIFSLILMFVNSLIACLAFWLGLRVVDDRIEAASN